MIFVSKHGQYNTLIYQADNRDFEKKFTKINNWSPLWSPPYLHDPSFSNHPPFLGFPFLWKPLSPQCAHSLEVFNLWLGIHCREGGRGHWLRWCFFQISNFGMTFYKLFIGKVEAFFYQKRLLIGYCYRDCRFSTLHDKWLLIILDLVDFWHGMCRRLVFIRGDVKTFSTLFHVTCNLKNEKDFHIPEIWIIKAWN